MHMKRFLTLALSALLAAGLLTACGGTSDGSADTAEVSLSSFYAGLAKEYGWTEDAASSGEDTRLQNGPMQILSFTSAAENVETK